MTSNHICGPADVRPVEGSNAYYSEHQQRGTVACGWSRECRSLYEWKRKHPGQGESGWPGFVSSDDRRSADRPYLHNCGLDPQEHPLEATNSYRREHQHRGTPPCPWAQACNSLAVWLDAHPDLTADDYPGWRLCPPRGRPRLDLDRPYLHDCDLDPGSHPLEATNSYRKEHAARGTPPCAWARACNALSVWLTDHPDRTASDYPGWQQTHNGPTDLYRYRYLDDDGAGDPLYYGISSVSADRREQGYGYNEEMTGWHRSGRLHERVLLARYPTRTEAEDAETLLIQLADRFGLRLLNKAKRLPEHLRGQGLDCRLGTE